LHHGRRLLAPARAAQVDLARTAHAVALQKPIHGALRCWRQGAVQISGSERSRFELLEHGGSPGIGLDVTGSVPQGQVHLGSHVVGKAPAQGQCIVLSVRQTLSQVAQQVQTRHRRPEAGDEARQDERKCLVQHLFGETQARVKGARVSYASFEARGHGLDLALKSPPFDIRPEQAQDQPAGDREGERDNPP
jgi:hypothetical protein